MSRTVARRGLNAPDGCWRPRPRRPRCRHRHRSPSRPRFPIHPTRASPEQDPAQAPRRSRCPSIATSNSPSSPLRSNFPRPGPTARQAVAHAEQPEAGRPDQRAHDDDSIWLDAASVPRSDQRSCDRGPEQRVGRRSATQTVVSASYLRTHMTVPPPLPVTTRTQGARERSCSTCLLSAPRVSFIVRNLRWRRPTCLVGLPRGLGTYELREHGCSSQPPISKPSLARSIRGDEDGRGRPRVLLLHRDDTAVAGQRRFPLGNE